MHVFACLRCLCLFQRACLFVSVYLFVRLCVWVCRFEGFKRRVAHYAGRHHVRVCTEVRVSGLGSAWLTALDVIYALIDPRIRYD